MRKLFVIVACLLAVTAVNARAQTVLTKCQRIVEPGTYALEAVQDAAATGACFDVTAANVHITGPSLVTCSSHGWAVTFEAYAGGGVMDGGSSGSQFNSCLAALYISHQIKEPGVAVNFTKAGPMRINGGLGCQYSIVAADSERVHLNFGTGGLQGTCPDGEISPHVGGNLPTAISGMMGPQ